MRLVSVNVSEPKTVQYRGKVVTTGIFKEPVQGRVRVRKLNLDGDGQADSSVQGGPDKAVYAYPVEHYDVWARELDRNLAYGQFGENLTVEGMLEPIVHIGDVFRIGSALLQVTQPRVPCYKLALKMGSITFPKRFLASGRVGYYFRVLEGGTVGAGDHIERVTIHPVRITIQQTVQLAFSDHENISLLEEALTIPALSPEWQSILGERLARAGHAIQ